MGILSGNLKNVNPGGTDYKENDSGTIILIRFWLSMLNLKNLQHLKNDKWRININSVAS